MKALQDLKENPVSAIMEFLSGIMVAYTLLFWLIDWHLRSNLGANITPFDPMTNLIGAMLIFTLGRIFRIEKKLGIE